MHQFSTASIAILTAASRANIQPSKLLRITASALAEKYCTCHDLLAGVCPSCREASRLDSIANKVADRAEAVEHIIDVCINTGTNPVDLLPGIVEGMLDLNPAACSCTGDTMCPICFAARELDLTARALAA